MTLQENLDCQKYKDIIFERLNSKYNRLWEQITNVLILNVQIISAYFIGILAYNTSNPSNNIMFGSITLLVTIIIIGLSLATGRLELERTETKKDIMLFFNKLK